MSSSSGLQLAERMARDLADRSLEVTPTQLDRLTRYLELLHQWNRRINLSGAKSPEVLWERHLLDCLMLSRVPGAAASCRWIDVGSGAGLPGLVLALLYPQARITAVETVAKKATFLQFVIGALELHNAEVLRHDVHTLSARTPGFEPHDRMVARAFAALPELLRLAPRLLRPGGELWAMKGERWREESVLVTPSDLAPFLPAPERSAYRIRPGAPEGVVLVYRLRHGEDSDSRD